jgi:hypothetical protein
MVAPVKEAGSSLEIGAPPQLFEVDNYPVGQSFDVTPDGRRFIANIFHDQATPPITLLIHWPAAIEKK